MRNKQYRRTEEAILEVLLNSREMPSTGELARRARVSRATLYRHHRAIPGIVPDYEREVLKRYRRMVRKLSKQRGMKLKNVYLQTLFFVLRNRRVFEILFRYEGGRVVERMVLEDRGKIARVCRLPGKSRKVVRIYAKEVAGVIEEWGRKGFKEEEAEKVLEEIMYLTGTMRERLGPLGLNR